MLDFSRNAARLLVAFAATVLLASCGGSSDDTPAAPPFGSTTVIFGASVSDTGNACNLAAANCPTSPPYATGKYSNGPLWIETVAARYGASATPSRLNGFNYAYAGATTGTVPGSTASRPPSMVQQVDQYLTRVNFQVSPSTLFIIDGITVGNNIADALTQVLGGNANAPAAVITQAVTDIVGIINRLYAAGARTIVFVNSVDIGKTPRVTSLNNPTATAGATQMSQQFNGAVAQQIATIRAGAPGLALLIVDAYAMEAGIQAAPGANGFTNVTAPCVVTTPSVSVCSTPDTYYYWDPFHPTFATGQRLAQETIRVIGR